MTPRKHFYLNAVMLAFLLPLLFSPLISIFLDAFIGGEFRFNFENLQTSAFWIGLFGALLYAPFALLLLIIIFMTSETRLRRLIKWIPLTFAVGLGLWMESETGDIQVAAFYFAVALMVAYAYVGILHHCERRAEAKGRFDTPKNILTE